MEMDEWNGNEWNGSDRTTRLMPTTSVPQIAGPIIRLLSGRDSGAWEGTPAVAL